MGRRATDDLLGAWQDKHRYPNQLVALAGFDTAADVS
jgi:hypothetical protein